MCLTCGKPPASTKMGPVVAMKIQIRLLPSPESLKKTQPPLLVSLLEDDFILKYVVLSVVPWKALSQFLGFWLPTMETFKSLFGCRRALIHCLPCKSCVLLHFPGTRETPVPTVAFGFSEPAGSSGLLKLRKEAT